MDALDKKTADLIKSEKEKDLKIKELEGYRKELERIKNEKIEEQRDELKRKYEDLSIKFEQLKDAKLDQALEQMSNEEREELKGAVNDNMDDMSNDNDDAISDFTEVRNLKQERDDMRKELEMEKKNNQRLQNQLTISSKNISISHDPNSNIQLK